MGPTCWAQGKFFLDALDFLQRQTIFWTKAKRVLPTLLRGLIKKRKSGVICGEAHGDKDSVLTALHDVYKAQPRKSLREACFSCFASSSSRSSVKTGVLTSMRFAHKKVHDRRVERDVLKTSPPWAGENITPCAVGKAPMGWRIKVAQVIPYTPQFPKKPDRP